MEASTTAALHADSGRVAADSGPVWRASDVCVAIGTSATVYLAAAPTTRSAPAGAGVLPARSAATTPPLVRSLAEHSPALPPFFAPRGHPAHQHRLRPQHR